MDLKLSDIEAKSTTNYNVERLQKWLNYELSSLLLWVACNFVIFIWFYVLIIASAAAIVFIPFLINILLQEKHYGWIIAFFVLILIPPLIVYLTIANSTWTWIAAFTALGFFYFYCALLRIVIREW